MRGTATRIAAASALVALLASCSSPKPATIQSIDVTTPTLPSGGGSDAVRWSGADVLDYTLAIAPATGVVVNGAAYAAPVDMGTATSVTLTLPSNPSGAAAVHYTVTLTATGEAGTDPVTKSATVDVAAVGAPVITGFDPGKATLTYQGGDDTLSWSGTNVTGYSLAVVPGTGVSVNGNGYNGPVDLGPATTATVTLPAKLTGGADATYTFTLTAAGASGTTADSRDATITVSAYPDPAIVGFKSSTQALDRAGGSVTLSWSGQYVNGYRLSVSPSTGVTVNGAAYTGAVSFASSSSGATATLPANSTGSGVAYTFTLTATGASGTTPSASNLAVTVSGVPHHVYSGGSYNFVSLLALGVDPSNNVWISGGYLTELPAGNRTGPVDVAKAPMPGNPAFDSAGNLWTTSYNTAAQARDVLHVWAPTFQSATGFGSSLGFVNPQSVALDAVGNVWVTDLGTTYGTGSVFEIATNLGVTQVTASTFTAIGPIAVDGSGNVWFLDGGHGVVTTPELTELPAPSRTPVYYSPYVHAMDLAIDGAGNVWVTNEGASISELVAADKSRVVFDAAAYQFSSTYGIAVDGAGNVWVTNSTGNSVTEIPAADRANPRVFSDPAFGFDNPRDIAIDASGDVWVIDYGASSTSNAVTQLVGVAAPLPFKVPLGP